MSLKIKKILDLFTVDKYYLMSNEALENEAAKWHIGGYVVPLGPTNVIDRQVIIDALIKKDSANNSRIAIFVSIIALVISILGIILK
jgi:hypothetical protein